jgi:hypothetical protein
MLLVPRSTTKRALPSPPSPSLTSSSTRPTSTRSASLWRRPSSRSPSTSHGGREQGGAPQRPLSMDQAGLITAMLFLSRITSVTKCRVTPLTKYRDEKSPPAAVISADAPLRPGSGGGPALLLRLAPAARLGVAPLTSTRQAEPSCSCSATTSTPCEPKSAWSAPSASSAWREH